MSKLTTQHGTRIFYKDFNREGADVVGGLNRKLLRQSVMDSAKARHDCITAFSATDISDDLKAVSLPVFLMHGEDDQVVPIDASARKARAFAERRAEDLSGSVARHIRDTFRSHQRRSARVYRRMKLLMTKLKHSN